MPNAVFDGLADIFTETLGEPVIYTPVATGIPVEITAIWREDPIEVDVLGVSSDETLARLHVRAVDAPDPREGDSAMRVSDGKMRVITTPIHPDGKGMIACNLGAPD